MAIPYTNELGELAITELRKRPKLRFALLIVSFCISVVALILWATALYFVFPVREAINKIAPGVLIIAGVVFLIVLAAYIPEKQRKGTVIENELEEIRQEREQIRHRVSEKQQPDIFDTIQLNLNQLSEYYTINKSQARNSFRFSVAAIVLGLLILLIGIWLYYFRQNENLQLATISGIAGVVSQFIGAAYFYLHRKSLEQLNYFYEQLVRMQYVMLSIKLCEEVPQGDKQVELREKVILSLLERSTKSVAIPNHRDEFTQAKAIQTL